MDGLPHQQMRNWLAQMLAIRCFEEAAVTLFHAGQVVGHPHVYIGQEATGVAAIGCLKSGDTLYSNHRNHGHLLARGADPARLLAEVLGRATGYNGGHGGTMHTVVPELGIFHTPAMVGAALPQAGGSALAACRRGRGEVVLVFFGDGALEEGIAYEAMNLAALWRLPVIYICENNTAGALGRAAGERPASSIAAPRLVDVPAAMGLPTAVVDGGDPEAVHEAMTAAVLRARGGGGASFIEACTVRWPGNRLIRTELVTGATDVAMAWNPDLVPATHPDWFQSGDPVLRLARRLLSTGAATPADLQDLMARARTRVSAAVSFALESPFPAPESALAHVLAAPGGC